MYSATFIFEKKQYDEEFYKLDRHQRPKSPHTRLPPVLTGIPRL